MTKTKKKNNKKIYETHKMAKHFIKFKKWIFIYYPYNFLYFGLFITYNNPKSVKSLPLFSLSL